MGIDIFIVRETAVQEDDKADLFHIDQGHVGYLREAYDGGPYATQMLVKEAYNAPTFTAQISAATLRERLHEKQDTTEAAMIRPAEAIVAALKVITKAAQGVGHGDATQHSDKPAHVTVEETLNKLTPEGIAAAAEHIANRSLLIPRQLTVLEAVALRNKLLYNMPDDDIKAAIQAFVDFVDLADRLEKETGHPCTIRASY